MIVRGPCIYIFQKRIIIHTSKIAQTKQVDAMTHNTTYKILNDLFHQENLMTLGEKNIYLRFGNGKVT